MFLVYNYFYAFVHITVYLVFFQARVMSFVCKLHIGKYFLNEIGSTTNFYTFAHNDRYEKDG